MHRSPVVTSALLILFLAGLGIVAIGAAIGFNWGGVSPD